MNHDDLTTTLTRELHDRADGQELRHLALDDVTGRARTIRRRRTTTAVVGVAAAVALIVPTAALATRDTGSHHTPAPATQSVTPTQTAEDGSDQPPPGVLDVSSLPTGAAPGMEYVENGVLHFADGGSGTVGTRYTPRSFVEMNDGSRVWGTADETGNQFVEIQDSDGTFHDPQPIGSGPNVNPTHGISAWITRDGQVMVWEGRASEPRPLGDPVRGADLRLGPITGEQCSLACSVIVNVADRQQQPWEVSDNGSQPLRDGGYLRVADMSAAGLTTGLTKITDFDTCSTLLGGGEFQGFRTCKNQLTSFSPDGKLVLALPSYFDGVGPGGLGMYDLSGQRLFERAGTEKIQAYFANAVWEDADHLVADVYQDGTWRLVRFASDGSMTDTGVSTKGPFDSPPFVLPTGGPLG